MKRLSIARALIVGTVVAAAWMSPKAGAQAPACLHGANETPAEAARRKAAVGFVRAINTAQARAFPAANVYRSMADLAGLPPAPTGFQAQLAVEGKAYALSVKDTTDQCGWALFSDQQGIIFTGTPLQ